MKYSIKNIILLASLTILVKAGDASKSTKTIPTPTVTKDSMETYTTVVDAFYKDGIKERNVTLPVDVATARIYCDGSYQNRQTFTMYRGNVFEFDKSDGDCYTFTQHYPRVYESCVSTYIEMPHLTTAVGIHYLPSLDPPYEYTFKYTGIEHSTRYLRDCETITLTARETPTTERFYECSTKSTLNTHSPVYKVTTITPITTTCHYSQTTSAFYFTTVTTSDDGNIYTIPGIGHEVVFLTTCDVAKEYNFEYTTGYDYDTYCQLVTRTITEPTPDTIEPTPTETIEEPFEPTPTETIEEPLPVTPTCETETVTLSQACDMPTVTVTEKEKETVTYTLSQSCDMPTVTVTEKETVTWTLTQLCDMPTNLVDIYAGKCASKWAQCGGEGYNGPTCCESGSKCTKYNKYFSQCV